MPVDRICAHSFFSAPLEGGAIVVDLGANQGEFAATIIDKYNVAVYAVEPVPKLFGNLPKHEKFHPQQIAIGGEEGEITINVYDDRCASTVAHGNTNNFEAIPVPCTTLENFLEQSNLASVDLLKVDIEGSEIEMFNSVPDQLLNNIGQITIEFHDFLYPELGEKTKSVIQRLENSGFYRINFSNDNTDVLFVNRRKVQIGTMTLLLNKYVIKYLLGMFRMFNRLHS